MHVAMKIWLKIALNAAKLPKFVSINWKSWSPRMTVLKDLGHRQNIVMYKEIGVRESNAVVRILTGSS